MRFFAFLTLLCGLCFMYGTPVYAQDKLAEKFEQDIPLYSLWVNFNPEHKIAPDKSINEAILNFKGPKEVAFPKVDFYEFEKPGHLEGRVDRLMHGINITLPAEYDHYGYEIRRYMKSIGRLDIFANRYAIEEEIVNVEKAWVVFRYWREALLGDISSIEDKMRLDSSVSSKIKTKFNVNKEKVTAFIIEMQSWINTNDDLLKFLADNRRQYTFERGRFYFKSRVHAAQFIEFFSARERAKRQIRNYYPFGSVVY